MCVVSTADQNLSMCKNMVNACNVYARRLPAGILMHRMGSEPDRAGENVDKKNCVR